MPGGAESLFTGIGAFLGGLGVWLARRRESVTAADVEKMIETRIASEVCEIRCPALGELPVMRERCERADRIAHDARNLAFPLTASKDDILRRLDRIERTIGDRP